MKRLLLIVGLWAGLSATPAAAQNRYFDLAALNTHQQDLEWVFNPNPRMDPGFRFAQTGSVEEETESKAPSFLERFGQGQTQLGLDFGFGYTFDLPPVDEIGDRTNFNFLYIFPQWKYNLTGVKGQGPWQGALYWVIEAGAAITVSDPTLNEKATADSPLYVVGFTPIQVEYKFLNPQRPWAPFLFAGAGISVGDFNRGARELDTALEFILTTGGGLEYFFDNGTSVSVSYHFWHLSNSNIRGSNIGLNSHVFTLGMHF